MKQINIKDFLDMSNDDIMEKNGGKKFDIVLMNPPYDRSLHLKFLEKTTEISNKVISIQPVTWLQNVFADQNKNAKINKIKLNDIEFLGKVHKVFPTLNGKATYDVGIIYIDKNSKVNTDLLYNFIELYEGEQINPELIKSIKYKILDFCKENNLENHIKVGEIDDKSKYCIIMPILVGNVGIKNDKFFWRESKRWGRIFYHGKSEGKTPGEYKKKLRNVQNYKSFNYLEFDTENECNNWIDSQDSDIMRFITIINSVDANRRCKFVPYMNDYSKVWTDDRLAKFFNITKEEQKEISKYINLFDKKFNHRHKIEDTDV